MSKYLNKTVAFLLVLIFIISNCIIATAETSYTKGYITIYNVSNNERISYEAIDVNGELFVSSDDIAKIINMEATTCDDSVFYSNYYANRSIDVCFDGSIWTRGITYKATVHNIDGTYFFPLEKMLYLANAQWCVENNIMYVQLTDNTILDFIDAYYMEILDNNITQTELLMNGESELSNAAKSSFAAIFNDFDVRVFVPIWGAITLTVEDYQNAMLQLAKDELEFIDEYGQKNLDDLLDKSSFSEIKSIWDDAQSVADLPKNILSATDYVNQTYLWIKDTKNGTKMFSEYNNLADFTPAEIGAISKELQGVSYILTIANAIVNVNEIATRSKSWNEDFLAQIELLTNFDETGYNKSMVNYIKKASTSLLEEHADTFSATIDACVEETLKVLGEKLVDLTPAGTLTSIITTGLSVAKLLDEDFATSFDALELSNMVEWLIRIEHVAFTEMSRDIVTMRMKSLNGGSTLEELTELRNTTMLALRTNLRNKVFIYYLNTVRNNDISWVDSDEAKEIEQDILWNYAKIVELSESEPFDRLLILDSLENIYSNEYGCKRDKINSDVLSETNAILSPESAVEIYMANKNVWIENPEYMPMGGYGYCLLDLNFDGVLELINSVNDGSGRYSYNKFYKINLESLTVEEFQPQLDQQNGGADYYYMSHKSKLLKNNSNGTMFYLFEDYLRVNDIEGSSSYFEIQMKDEILCETELFSEYWGPDYENNTENQIRKYTFLEEKVSKSTYEQKKKAFYEKNVDLNLVWKCISGFEFDDSSDSTQKQLLLNAYYKFSYDGFSFDNVDTYDAAPRKQAVCVTQSIRVIA